MLIDESGPEYKKLFGNVDPWGQFTSLQPSAEVVQAQLADPSINPNIEPTDEIDLDLNAYQAVTDLKTGTGRMVQKIALPGNVEGTFGFLASSTTALENILQYESVPGFMNPTEVYQALGQATKGVSPEKAIQAVAFTVGMSALSAMGPVGAAAAAIVGFVVAIGKAFMSRAKLAELNEEQRLIEAYKQFPPLMEPSAEVDTHTVNNSILPVLQTGDWTNLFSPRFSSSQWKAIQRNGGFAVAPGEAVEGQNAFGEENQVFNPTAGVGYLPGRNRITSVLQINLDPLSNRVKQWEDGATSTNYILDQTRVIDVGDYLLNSTKFCAIAWAWATSKKRSPHLYKIDVQKLHDRWKRYCDSGINTLRALDPNKRSLDSLYKSAIGCAVGTWECMRKTPRPQTCEPPRRATRGNPTERRQPARRVDQARRREERIWPPSLVARLDRQANRPRTRGTGCRYSDALGSVGADPNTREHADDAHGAHNGSKSSDRGRYACSCNNRRCAMVGPAATVDNVGIARYCCSVFRAIFTLALVLTPAACGSSVGERCSETEECRGDLKCVGLFGSKNGQCSAACYDDTDCPSGVCHLVANCVAACTSNSDCPADTACAAGGFCQATCGSAADCYTDQVCDSSQLCVYPPPCETNEDCTLVGQICDAGACVTPAS